MNDTPFPGVAFVTGAASGIGRAIAIAFAQDGCKKLALCDVNKDGLEETKSQVLKSGRQDSESNISVLIDIVDVGQESMIQKFVTETVEKFGGIHYAVNVAGIGSFGQPSTETPSSAFDRIHAINCRGVWLSSKYEIEAMLKQDSLPSNDGRPSERGSIINIASQLGLVGIAGGAAYASAKAAVISMTKCDAKDYSAHGIRVNSVCPGCTETPMTAMTTESSTKNEWLASIVERTPMKRMGATREIADAVMFLSSRKASFIQGHALVVDGGYVL